MRPDFVPIWKPICKLTQIIKDFSAVCVKYMWAIFMVPVACLGVDLVKCVSPDMGPPIDHCDKIFGGIGEFSRDNCTRKTSSHNEYLFHKE